VYQDYIDLQGTEARLTTYNQYSDVLARLDLQSIMKRLVGCSEGQPKARRLHEIERLRLVSAAELANELILCVASLASRGTNVGDVVAWLVEFAVRTNLQNSAGAIEANDVEVFGSMFVVIWIESAARAWTPRQRALIPGASS
jgi:hypothetical protein